MSVSFVSFFSLHPASSHRLSPVLLLLATRPRAVHLIACRYGICKQGRHDLQHQKQPGLMLLPRQDRGESLSPGGRAGVCEGSVCHCSPERVYACFCAYIYTPLVYFGGKFRSPQKDAKNPG